MVLCASLRASCRSIIHECGSWDAGGLSEKAKRDRSVTVRKIQPLSSAPYTHTQISIICIQWCILVKIANKTRVPVDLFLVPRCGRVGARIKKLKCVSLLLGSYALRAGDEHGATLAGPGEFTEPSRPRWCPSSVRASCTPSSRAPRRISPSRVPWQSQRAAAQCHARASCWRPGRAWPLRSFRHG